MFLSELPIFLLLIYGVTSVDLNLNKRILRRNTEVIRTNNLNHPPAVENYDLIPREDKERSHSKKNLDINPMNGKSNLENLSDSNQSVNNPPSNNLASPVNNDYEEDTIDNPKARSIKIMGLERSGIDYGDFGAVARPKPQRRRSQVRKVKVNKSQLDAYLNETENSLNKTDESKLEVNRTGTSEHSTQMTKRGQSFQKRKQLRDPVIPIIESESYVFSHSGNFHYSYEGGDGTKAFEKGELKTSNGGAGSAVEGNYSYKDKDGNDFSLSYTADENGYRPVGAHLPTPPPIPPAIQRALDLLATKTTPEPITERIKTL